MRIVIRFKLEGTEAVGAITMVGQEAEAITMAGGIAADRERVLAALVAAFFRFGSALVFRLHGMHGT